MNNQQQSGTFSRIFCNLHILADAPKDGEMIGYVGKYSKQAVSSPSPLEPVVIDKIQQLDELGFSKT